MYLVCLYLVCLYVSGVPVSAVPISDVPVCAVNEHLDEYMYVQVIIPHSPDQ